MDDYSKGVVFYLNKPDGKIVGVLTWNLFGKMDLAKQVELYCTLVLVVDYCTLFCPDHS